MTTHHQRQFPIILVTGTPGTGKTLHSTLLSQNTQDTSYPLTHLNVGDLVKTHGFHEGWDEEWQSWTVDEDRLLDHMEEIVNPESGPATTGFIIDHHDPSLFPERWIDLVVVLRCDNSVLHSRLTERNYKPNKLEENITAEIMMTCLTDSRESYAEEIIVELQSDGEGDTEVEENVRRITEWVEKWKQDRVEGKHDE